MTLPTSDTSSSPWHPGELQIQKSLGVAERMLDVGRRVIRDYMPDQHREFFSTLPFVVLASVGSDGDVWATLLTGSPGFMQSPTKDRLHVGAMPAPEDPATEGLVNGASVGLLGIELHSRRRNRLNGSIVEMSASGFGVSVAQSFGNCPQYIQARNYQVAPLPPKPPDAGAVHSERLSDKARAMITGADTFFVASYIGTESEGRHVDVSHRGGKAGFVRIGDDGVLTVPDFAGNLFFATLGNFIVNPRAGLVFADFESGDLLQLVGDAQVVLQSPEIAAFQGAERLWRFTPRHIIFRASALPLRWTFTADGWSPNSLMTGDWDEAASRIKAAEFANSWRQFKIAKITDESSVIRSFQLEPVDGAGLIPHLAGQHLPIRLTPEECGKPVIRTYTLSSGPADGIYRISVKRQGVASRHLHGNLRVGDVIEARAPAGQFTIDAHERRPAVLLAAGVGITPMLSMLKHIVYEGLRTRRVRPTWFFHSARTLAERAFSNEISRLADRANGAPRVPAHAAAHAAVHVIRSLTHTEGAREGEDYDVAGRIDMAMLRGTLPFDDYDFYLCGPAEFMQGIYDGLRRLNIADSRIHAESFGSLGLLRKTDAPDSRPARVSAVNPTPVAFVGSGKEARWSPASGSLLELAEARGLAPEFGCRGGSCGTCRTRIVEGKVAYLTSPEFKVPDNEALICCAVPASVETGGGERLLLDL
jgi:uncharacterized protein